MTNHLAFAEEAFSKPYPTDSVWPTEDRPSYSLRDYIRKLKEKVMKTSIMMGNADGYYYSPFAVYHNNIIVKTVPPPYKYLILTQIIEAIGHSLSEVLGKI